MVSCEVGGIAQESLLMGSGGGDEVTAELRRDSPSGTVDRQRSLWSENVSAGLLVQWLTKHPTQYTHRLLLLTAIICQCEAVQNKLNYQLPCEVGGAPGGDGPGMGCTWVISSLPRQYLSLSC